VTGAEDDELVEYDGTGAVTRRYEHGRGVDEALNDVDVAGGSRRTPIPDIQGSTIGWLESGGTLTKAGYRPFGQSASTSGPAYRYTGRRIEPEANWLYYYRARSYSPALGRFLQPDPVGHVIGTNLYAYVNNDPLNLRDSTGLVIDTIADVGFIVYDLGLLAYDETFNSGANRTSNLIALGLDVGAAAVPFATGAGVTYRAGNKLTKVASQADAAVPLGGSASVRGTAVHTEFNALVAGGAAGRNVAPETAYIAGAARPQFYRPAGSVNPDAVVGNINSPAAIFDLKTGASGISPSQLSRYESGLPSGTSVFELRTTGHTALRPTTYTGIGALGNAAYQSFGSPTSQSAK
jgi:RHS repeat-associated protein